MKREHYLGAAVLIVVASGILLLVRRHPIQPARPAETVRLQAIGPRLVSNQTSQPLALYGSGFRAGMQVVLDDPASALPATVLDDGHAYVRLPPRALPPADVQRVIPVQIRLPDGTLSSPPLMLTVVNDAAFVDFTAAVTARTIPRTFALSPNTDQLFVVDADAAPKALSTGDGPSALDTWQDDGGAEHLVVAHLYEPALRLYDVAHPEAGPRSLKAPAYASGLVVGDGGIAYLAEVVGDTVSAIDLRTGEVKWRAPVDPNPRALALCGTEWLAVGSLQAGTIDVLDRASGRLLRRIAPGPDTSIVGGGTDQYERYIMGGTAPRALAWSEALQRLFVSSIGPDIGPNPDRMEVSMNGGVGVVDVTQGTFLRHLGFGMGVTGALALDDHRGLLYAADPALGIVRVLDAKALTRSDEAAAGALRESVELPVPDDFPLVRPAADFGVHQRATRALHAGPAALGLTPDGSSLTVIDRFTGDAVLFATPLQHGQAGRVQHLSDTTIQKTRRLGQILYYADLGHSAMSCDACHLEGHTGGVLFAKTHPLRIYRSPTLRAVRESPPYFTPASTFSLAETAKIVGGRNRYHNPDPSPAEIEALALFTSELTLLPNPYVGADGAPVETLTLPDGTVGHPRLGLNVFEQSCSGCHPAPHFTRDQEPATRGQYLDVGTPPLLALREPMQEAALKTFGIPPLVGSWDVWPMLGTGSAGFAVREDGTLEVNTRFPLREVVEKYSGPKHGNAAALTPEERNDLIAYLLSL